MDISWGLCSRPLSRKTNDWWEVTPCRGSKVFSWWFPYDFLQVIFEDAWRLSCGNTLNTLFFNTFLICRSSDCASHSNTFEPIFHMYCIFIPNVVLLMKQIIQRFSRFGRSCCKVCCGGVPSMYHANAADFRPCWPFEFSLRVFFVAYLLFLEGPKFPNSGMIWNFLGRFSPFAVCGDADDLRWGDLVWSSYLQVGFDPGSLGMWISHVTVVMVGPGYVFVGPVIIWLKNYGELPTRRSGAGAQKLQRTLKQSKVSSKPLQKWIRTVPQRRRPELTNIFFTIFCSLNVPLISCPSKHYPTLIPSCFWPYQILKSTWHLKQLTAKTPQKKIRQKPRIGEKCRQFFQSCFFSKSKSFSFRGKFRKTSSPEAKTANVSNKPGLTLENAGVFQLLLGGMKFL